MDLFVVKILKSSHYLTILFNRFFNRKVIPQTRTFHSENNTLIKRHEYIKTINTTN